MKVFKGIIFTLLGIAMIAFTFLIIRNNHDSSVLSNLEAMSYQEQTLEINETFDQDVDSGKLSLYIQELRKIHVQLLDQRDEIHNQVDSLKDTRSSFEEDGIVISPGDREEIVESFRIMRLNRYMIQQAYGQGYYKLLDLKNHQENYTTEEIKDILIEVYETLNARLTMYQHISNELTHIQAILDNY